MFIVVTLSLWVLARWSIGYPILSGALSFAEWKKKVMNPPVKACLFGIVSGLLWNEVFPAAWRESVARSMAAPTRDDEAGELASTESSPPNHPVLVLIGAALKIVQTALGYAGRCCVPCVLIILGSSVYEAAHQYFSDRAARRAWEKMGGGKKRRGPRDQRYLMSVDQDVPGEDVAEDGVGSTVSLRIGGPSPSAELVGNELVPVVVENEILVVEKAHNYDHSDSTATASPVQQQEQFAARSTAPSSVVSVEDVALDVPAQDLHQTSSPYYNKSASLVDGASNDHCDQQREDEHDSAVGVPDEVEESVPSTPITPDPDAYFPVSAYLSVMILRQVVGPVVSLGVCYLLSPAHAGMVVVEDKVVLMLGFLRAPRFSNKLAGGECFLLK